MTYFPGDTACNGCTATSIAKSPLYTLSCSSGEKGNVISLPWGYPIFPRMMSVGRSIFRLVGIRYSDFGVLELMWNPDATRKFKLTIVCAARGAVTSATVAIDTEGDFPPCAAAVPASRATTKITFELCVRKFIPVTLNSRASAIQRL